MSPSTTGVQSRRCYFKEHPESFILFVPSVMKLHCVVAPPSNQENANYGGKFSWPNMLCQVGFLLLLFRMPISIHEFTSIVLKLKRGW